MSEPAAVYEIRPDDKVRVRRHPEWGTGEVLRVSQTLGVYQAKVLFKAPDGERVESLPIEWLEKAAESVGSASPRATSTTPRTTASARWPSTSPTPTPAGS